MCRASRTIHHVHSLAGEATTLQQPFETRAQRGIIQALEPVEQWCDPDRVGPGDEQRKCHPQQPRPQPPQLPGPLHQPQDRGNQRHAQDQAQQQTQQAVLGESARGGAVETKPGLDPEGPPDRQRQIDNRADKHYRDDQSHAVPQRAWADRADCIVQPSDAACDGPAEQHRAAQHQFPALDTQAGDAVTRRRLVLLERNVCRERRWHDVRMSDDVCGLARRQPQLQRETGDDGEHEYHGEGAHGRDSTTPGGTQGLSASRGRVVRAHGNRDARYPPIPLNSTDQLLQHEEWRRWRFPRTI